MRKILLLLVDIYTRVVATIFTVSTLYNLIFFGTASKLGIDDIAGVLLIGFISAICYLMFFIPKEISKRLMLIMQSLYFTVIDVTVITVGHFLHWFSFKDASFIGMEITIILVYVIVNCISYILNRKETEKINEKLKQRNKE